MSLSAQNIFVSYNDEFVLQNISFQLDRGEMLAIIGPNGSGKTTLLRTLLGLIRPQKGQVLLDGSPPSEALRRSPGIAAYLPQSQNINTLLPLSVYDVVTQGFKAKKIWAEGLSAEEHALAQEALERVEMGAYKNRLFKSLSGGQRQRVLVALALAGKPKYLFLDEPTSALDFASVDKLYHLLAGLKENMGILIITHDIGAITGSADRIALLMHEFKYLGAAKKLPQEALREVFGCHIQLLPEDPCCDICQKSGVH